MQLDGTRTIRSSCLAVTFIARQFGVRINADFVENSIKRGDLTNSKELSNFFDNQGVITLTRKSKITDLQNKNYLYPCVCIMKSGQAYILIGMTPSDTGENKFLAIDPTDPSAAVQPFPENEFVEQWSRKLILVSPKGQNVSLNRPFDLAWFVPELARFKGALFLTLIVSVIVHALGITPIIFIQIALDKVLGYQALGTLYVLTLGVVLALIFLGILGFIRDYVISHVSSVIEARLTGDAFEKLLKLPSQTFQTTASSEIEAQVNAVTSIRLFLARQVLTNLYDATGILLFLPVLFGYSPTLALVVILFAILQGLVDLASKKQAQALAAVTSAAASSRNSTLRETITGIDASLLFDFEWSNKNLFSGALGVKPQLNSSEQMLIQRELLLSAQIST
ncbi:MAG: ABC transporter transmembrane domain-containing protein [Gammaproteobacteria bacterium]